MFLNDKEKLIVLKRNICHNTKENNLVNRQMRNLIALIC